MTDAARIARLEEVNAKLASEMQRYLPLLERIEADLALWERMTVFIGIATLNGYRAALAAAKEQQQ
jgi:hypothetical protein